jgi:hypothetical protein
MSRGLGTLQRDIKRVLDYTIKQKLGALRFADILTVFKEGERGMTPTHERSLKRALNGLVERGDVLILSGEGRSGDPYRYITVESFAAATGQKVRDTAHAREIVAELKDQAAEAMQKLARRG